ncbi:hypothetical protein RHGRI_009682 [Rhododendron griersonianum]|uniref:Uncharacterized protein n=1 Tax=Rhododendron griersonianum TaxID=479676 RepID=A0AAV6KFN6_9ERIC|nr:hypothetical protein RHGRI_009682 [Rhododendron griersonianum]
MSGSQGALPPGVMTATTYESVEGGENKAKLDPRSKEDEGGIEIVKLQDKVPPDASGPAHGHVFSAAKKVGDEEEKDLGATGMASSV